MGRMDSAYRDMLVEKTAGFDLNLLRALAVLIEEASVTRAADRLGVSQPAMSRTLGRLRDALGDSLLVRTGRGMRLTARAEAIREPLQRLMGDVYSLILTEPSFDPASARMRLCMAVDPCALSVVVPPLLGELARRAPGVKLEVTGVSGDSLRALHAGELDLLIAPSSDADDADLRRRVLFDDHFVCLVRRGHPALQADGSLTDFGSLERASLADAGAWGQRVELALRPESSAAPPRHVLPELSAVPFVLEASDLAVVLPRTVAIRLASLADLTIVELPMSLQPFRVAAFWHENMQTDPGHRWTRQVLCEVMADLGAGHDATTP